MGDIVAIVVELILLGLLILRAGRLGREDPEHREGYRRIAETISCVFVIYELLPLIGSTFRIPLIERSPLRIAAVWAAFAGFGVLTWWLLRRGGTAYLIEHGRFFNSYKQTSTRWVWLTWAVVLLVMIGPWVPVI